MNKKKTAKTLEILKYPDPRLRQKSEEIPLEKILSQEFQEFLDNLEITMIEKDGAGLAAPQVGRLERVVTISDNGKTYFLINPKINKRSWARESEEEGCLSLISPNGEIIYDIVERRKKVTCVYLDRQGKRQSLSGEKLLARAIQHEIDHLDGVLFIDHLNRQKISAATAAALEKLDKLKQ
jgi:peptide deformylase